MPFIARSVSEGRVIPTLLSLAYASGYEWAVLNSVGTANAVRSLQEIRPSGCPRDAIPADPRLDLIDSRGSCCTELGRDLLFTGIVECLVEVVKNEPRAGGNRLVLRLSDGLRQDVPVLGESIAINGCCLTVVEVAPDAISFDVGPETLDRTDLGELVSGDRVNIERSLRAADRLGGHYVTGHVDALGKLVERQDDEDWSTFWFQVPQALTAQMVSKGSVTVDGVSLTLVDVEQDRFSVALIPHTLAITTLGRLEIGDQVNIETDVLAKYVQRQMQAGLNRSVDPHSS